MDAHQLDDGSIFGIANTPTTGNSRGMDWDAALNLYVTSSGQGLLRIYSLGLTTTCITSNDFSGTNGSFNVTLPPVTASVVATTPLASQNYVNNTPTPGTPIPGVFRISLNTNTLGAPLTINFTRSGTAVYTNHYVINTNETPNGVTIAPNSVTFPAGTAPSGNWSVDVKITPTALPLSTNTLTVVLQVLGGAGNLAGSPARDTVYIQNTGPQLLVLTAAGSGTTMYRGVTNDYAKFIINRLGDTNGPNNSAGSVTPLSYTVNTVTYFGTATYPSDYRARAQRLDPAGDGAVVPPSDGPTAIVINPGNTTITAVVGNPVAHANLSAFPIDLTVVVTLTNNLASGAATTNLLSAESLPYTVGLATVSLTELDNAIGPEVVLWSNPLTNAADSVNWTLTFAATNFGPIPMLPAVFPNYVNASPGGPTNDFDVTFGRDISLDVVAPSRVMLASNWNNVLKMTVNKGSGFAQAGVNVYPQGQNFQGNYALRFNMYISLYQFALNNPGIGSAAREFALFGVNHRGTNCNWRTAAPVPANGGNSPTNSDGQWFAIGAGSGSITPADFDAFVPPVLPNSGVTADKVSNTAASQNGVFKHPPFDAANVASSTVGNPGGGEAVDKWVDVSVEITRQTNINVFVNRSQVLAGFPLTNAVSFTNGTIMLGYLDPVADQSDNSAFAYFSNVRVVELSPYIVQQAGLTNSFARNLIVPQFASLSFTSSATYATAPMTNTWYRGTGAFNSASPGVPTAPLQTNTFNGTSMSDSLTRTFNSAVDGTNYMSVFSDAAGSVTSLVVAVEVVLGPTNKTYNAGVTSNLLVLAVGPVAPTAYQWYFNTVSNLSTATKLANSAHYAGVTTNSLFLTNIVAGDAGFYWAAVTNSAGGVVPQAAVLTVIVPPSAAVVTPTPQNNLWGSNTTFTVAAAGTAPFTYQWKSNGVNLANSSHYGGVTTSSLTISNITAGDSASYTVGVTNSAGGTLSSAGVLTEVTPAPTISSVSVSGGNLTVTFTSTNPYDTSSSFVLVSSSNVGAPLSTWTITPATFSGTNPTFQVVVPQTGDTMFYRLRHKD